MDTIKVNPGKVKMIAHRGLSGIERENTCPAFVAAGNRSYFGIETDVHVTGDGQFVIIHDETTERVSNGSCNINVEKEPYSAVESVVLPDIDGTTDRKDIRIPLLSEYIKICKKYGKICVLEVKNHFAKEDLKSMVEEIKSLDYINNVIFISFDFENCINLREILPENKIQWLIGEVETAQKNMQTLTEKHIDIDIIYTALTKEAVDMLHAEGIEVNCWTCDNKEDAEKLEEMGVDFITTNILE